MQATLITAGIACVVAAIVGGGLTAYGIKVPGVESVPRQLLLGMFGLVLGALGFFGVNGGDDGVQADDGPTAPATDTETDTGGDGSDAGSDVDDSDVPLEAATGSGATPPCDTIVISVALREFVGDEAFFAVTVNNSGRQAIDLPPLSEVAFVDEAGTQWPQDRFANLGSTWAVGTSVQPGGTLEADIVLDAPAEFADQGRLEVPDLSPSDDPFRMCQVQVHGVPLR